MTNTKKGYEESDSSAGHYSIRNGILFFYGTFFTAPTTVIFSMIVAVAVAVQEAMIKYGIKESNILQTIEAASIGRGFLLHIKHKKSLTKRGEKYKIIYKK